MGTGLRYKIKEAFYSLGDSDDRMSTRPAEKGNGTPVYFGECFVGCCGVKALFCSRAFQFVFSSRELVSLAGKPEVQNEEYDDPIDHWRVKAVGPSLTTGPDRNEKECAVYSSSRGSVRRPVTQVYALQRTP